jgi:hypothetical protein
MKNGLYFGRTIFMNVLIVRIIHLWIIKKEALTIEECVILIYCYDQTYLKNIDVFKKIMLYYDNIKK